MKKKIALHIFIVTILTVLTQIGGIIYLMSLIFSKRNKWNKYKFISLFIGLYLTFTILVVPIIAPIFGRVPLPLNGKIQPLSIFTPFLNRHYVTPKLKSSLVNVSNEFQHKYSDYSINYLDANFPFIDGFRLLPHLSHGDGNKIDIAFLFQDTLGNPTNSARSPIGYGIHESPSGNEINYTEICISKGAYQYDLIRFFVPKWNSEKYKLDSEATSELISLLSHENNAKILLEPHLKRRWGLSSIDNIRFQGCHAVRHDDHIHFQVK